MTITVPTKHLKAALLAAGKQDIRYYLNGVYIESMPHETRCVATTGAFGCVLRSAANPLHAAIIVPRDVVEAAIKAKRDATEFAPGQGGTWVMNGTLMFKPVDGTYPSYRWIFVREVSGDGCRGFSPEVFATFGKMAAALGVSDASVVTTHLNGTRAAMVTIEGHPEFAGVIAPLNFTQRMGENGIGVQGWACE